VNLADVTREVIGWELLAKAVAERKEAARQRLLEEMVAASSLKQGTKDWGTASLTGGDYGAYTYDMAALVAWTAKYRPEMLVQVVRPEWLKLLEEITKTEGQPIDPETGAIVPGMRRIVRSHGLLVRTTHDARQAAQAVVGQMAAGLGQLALPKEDSESGVHP
jgi:hypothetical protein